jgi:hypothetical protein
LDAVTEGVAVGVTVDVPEVVRLTDAEIVEVPESEPDTDGVILGVSLALVPTERDAVGDGVTLNVDVDVGVTVIVEVRVPDFVFDPVGEGVAVPVRVSVIVIVVVGVSLSVGVPDGVS